MADVNMTIGSVVSKSGQSRMRRVTFTHTAATTAGGNATTSFPITGKLLAVMHTGGDAVWNFTLSNGTATLFTSGNLDNSTKFKTLGLSFDGSQPDAATDVSSAFGIPMVGETLLCTTTNVSTLAPTITVYWEESDTV